MRNLFFGSIMALLVSGCVSQAKDQYLWLEDIEGEKALTWVKAHNQKTLPLLESKPGYQETEASLRKIILATDRIPHGNLWKGFIYNFWQDDKNVRGIIRRASLAEYAKKDPKWETILDLDQIAKTENENWVYKRHTCERQSDRCLVWLSRGGGDASVIREFDLKTKTFLDPNGVEKGFYVEEGRNSADWIDRHTLLVAAKVGPDSLNESGNPREVRIWKRGQPLDSAALIFTGDKKDSFVWPFVASSPEGTFTLVVRMPTFFEYEYHLLTADNKLNKLNLPLFFNVETVFMGDAVGTVDKDWTTEGATYAAGSLIAFNLRSGKVQLIRAPQARSSIDRINRSRSSLYVGVLDNVRSRVQKYEKINSLWEKQVMDFEAQDGAHIDTTDAFEDTVLFNVQSFLVPPAVYSHSVAGREQNKKLRQLPARFQHDGLVDEQFEVASKDGTKIPYFVVRPKNIAFDGTAPTLLYGYGGFKNSETPYYMSTIGKVWSEKGGVYVLANIRGGGEFGPAWHEAALKKNRQRAFDDFAAVAEDLIRRMITSPRHLGIMGGSNGGLLVGTVMTQRPELFNAVVCQVPLLDMLRFHKLLVGATWVGEYGSPEISDERDYLATYSPYQNVKAGRKYPKVFFMTSTKDDRVHPGHARKMTAKMEEQGHDVLMYENIEGGHGAAANLEQRIKFSALTWTFLWDQLGK